MQCSPELTIFFLCRLEWLYCICFVGFKPCCDLSPRKILNSENVPNIQADEYCREKEEQFSFKFPFHEGGGCFVIFDTLGLKLQQFSYGETYLHTGAAGMRINGRSQIPKNKTAKQIVLYTGLLLLPAVSLQRSYHPQLPSLLFSLVFLCKDLSWIDSSILFRSPMFCQLRSVI